MSGKNTKGSSTSMLAIKTKGSKTPAIMLEPEATTTVLHEAPVVPARLTSTLKDLRKTEAFKDHAANDVRFHVSQNLLFLRRYRQESQDSLAKAMGTSQSAIARMEGGLENITLDTLERYIVKLKGRLYISIHPSEYPFQSPRPWWDVPASSSFSILGAATWPTEHGKQGLIGWEERSTSQPVDSLPPALLLGALLSEARTGNQG